MKKILFIPLAALLLVSCVGNKKITAAKNKLKGIEAQMQQEKNEIGGINTQAETKLAINKIDSNILHRIDMRLDKAGAALDSAQQSINLLAELLKDKKTARQNYKKIILPFLDSLQKQSDQYAARLALYLMIKDGLNVADFKLFDLAAFFGPGKYIIPEDKVDIASQSFKPVIDSLILFSNKYI